MRRAALRAPPLHLRDRDRLRRAAPRLYAHIVRFAENHARDVDREYARLRAPIQHRIDGARSACLVD